MGNSLDVPPCLSASTRGVWPFHHNFNLRLLRRQLYSHQMGCCCLVGHHRRLVPRGEFEDRVGDHLAHRHFGSVASDEGYLRQRSAKGRGVLVDIYLVNSLVNHGKSTIPPKKTLSRRNDKCWRQLPGLRCSCQRLVHGAYQASPIHFARENHQHRHGLRTNRLPGGSHRILELKLFLQRI